MGYRLHINFDESNLPEVLPIDGKYKASIKIENTGVSRILNEKKTKILMRGSHDYEFELFDDLRMVNSLSFYKNIDIDILLCLGWIRRIYSYQH